jgi:hypothetical protein
MAGRMVCGRCGKPLGRLGQFRAGGGGGVLPQLRAIRPARRWMLLLVLLALSASLAWLAEGVRQPFAPPSLPRLQQRGGG